MSVHTNQKHPGRMAKKSYTLSPESVAFLEKIRVQQHASSVSSVLEDLLQSLLKEQENAAIEGAIADYYSSLSRKEVQELTDWGEFAVREFPNEDV